MNSNYDKRLKNYLAYFKKNDICLFKPRYPLRHLVSLHRLVKEKLKLKGKEANLAESKNIVVGKNKAYWPFLSGVFLSIKNPEFIDAQEIPYTLSEFCRDTCEGSLDKAVQKIDQLIDLAIEDLHKLRYITDSKLEHNRKIIHLDDELEHNIILVLIDELKLSSIFMRNVRSIVQKDRSRHERTHEFKNTPYQNKLNTPSSENIIHDPDLKKIITKLKALDVDMTNIEYKDKPLYPKPKNQPNYLMEGYCILCHRPANQTDFYCSFHRKPKIIDKNKPNRAKGAQDIIKNAFNYLGYLLPEEKAMLILCLHQGKSIPKDSTGKQTLRDIFYLSCKDTIDEQKKALDIKNNNFFRSKAYFLVGWGEHHPLHIKFSDIINDITIEYFSKLGSTLWHTGHLFMLNDIKRAIDKHYHTDDFFKNKTPLFLGDEIELNVLDIQKDFLEINTTVILPPKEFIKIIKRKSIFDLIKIAASKTKHPKVINEDYEKGKLIKNII